MISLWFWYPLMPSPLAPYSIMGSGHNSLYHHVNSFLTLSLTTATGLLVQANPSANSPCLYVSSSNTSSTLKTGDLLKLQMFDTKTRVYLKIAFKGKFMGTYVRSVWGPHLLSYYSYSQWTPALRILTYCQFFKHNCISFHSWHIANLLLSTPWLSLLYSFPITLHLISESSPEEICSHTSYSG